MALVDELLSDVPSSILKDDPPASRMSGDVGTDVEDLSLEDNPTVLDSVMFRNLLNTVFSHYYYMKSQVPISAIQFQISTHRLLILHFC